MDQTPKKKHHSHAEKISTPSTRVGLKMLVQHSSPVIKMALHGNFLSTIILLNLISNFSSNLVKTTTDTLLMMKTFM
jgi:hypothetical protein